MTDMNAKISNTAIIYLNVKLGENCIIEDFAIIGAPPRGHQPGELETVIGDNAVIRSHTVIYAGNKIGKNFQTGNKVNIRELNEIGDDVSIGTLSVIEHHVKIGYSVRIHTQVFVPEFTILEDECWIGPNAVITNAKYPHSPVTKEKLAWVKIEQGGIIGANATIGPGVVIGKQVVVGMGSVVTKNVPEKMIVAGNPAKILRSVEEIPDYREKI